MSQQANPKVIGAFVVGAIALVVIGILLFGRAQFMSEKGPFVVYFEGSVRGLNVGAPVEFQGVRIGSVTDIQLQFVVTEREFRVPVFCEIEAGRITRVGEKLTSDDREKLIKSMIANGLRARLEMQSVVTGQLGIQLGFYPDTPIRLVGGDSKMPEIPTVPTTMEAITQTVTQALTEIKQLPIPQLINELMAAAQGLNIMVNGADMREFLRNVNDTARVAARSMGRVDEQTAQLADRLKDTIEAANVLLNDSQHLVRHLDAQMAPLSNGILKSLEGMGGILKDSQQLVRHIDAQVAPLAGGMADTSNAARVTLVRTQAAVEGDLIKMLQELSAAARSIRLLADYLERNPDALVYGKPGSRR